jgi:hypothetical protein
MEYTFLLILTAAWLLNSTNEAQKELQRAYNRTEINN